MSRIETPAPAPAQAQTHAGVATLLDGPFAANLALAGMAAQIAQEMMDFAGRRMRAQMDFVSTMPMGDVKGMMDAQVRFLEQASRDYVAEIAQVTDVMRKAGEAPPRR
ncbi:phasin family protein [Roseomonas sp. AR75]|uniref:phasin family protein n=1 Tax=Roseomonas sp. AR75 TaxID=2562311 RepID=UPI0010C14F0F|nr:hypothetical protein [Roseomonas sp. AR75]